MSPDQVNRRAFERTLRLPFHKLDDQPKETARKFFYQRLMQVSIHHRFYNREHFDCADFIIMPTPASAELMTSLGLLFKYDVTCMSVLYDVNRKDSLFQYLRRQGVLAAERGVKEGQVWVRLSFVLALNNPYFVNLTEIPIDLDPVQQNFYFTNQEAHETCGVVILTPGPRVTGEELLPVAPVQIPIVVGKDVKKVVVRAISGEVVICRPRCVPARRLADGNPTAITCEQAEECGPDNLTCRCSTKIYLDFSTLPEDKYEIETVGYDNNVINKLIVLYTRTATPIPLCFIDLFFTNPLDHPDSGQPEPSSGIFPIVDLWNIDQTRIVPVHYLLDFRNRPTFWSYYIVPDPQSENFHDLSIHTVQPSPRPINFLGPCCVRLANGSKAYRFISEESIPLQQQSDYRFRLVGRRGTMTHPSILVDRLPVASMQQVLPETRHGACTDLINSLCSDAASDAKCRKLLSQLCNAGCADSNLDECMEHLKSRSAEFMNEAPRRQQPPSNKNYSDIYVYV